MSFAISSYGRAQRSVNGCWTCRDKKVKCDEQRPVCKRCTRRELSCDYAPRSRKPYKLRKKAISGSSTNSQSSSYNPSLTPANHDATGYETTAGVNFGGLTTVPCTTQTLECSFTHTPELGEACSIVLGAGDYEAIRYYQVEYTRNHHTKTAPYNVLGIIYEIATKSSPVMHMVIAIARKEMLYLRADGSGEIGDDNTSILHYTAALRTVVEYLDELDRDTSLDTILATVYLMLSYEQRFGDSDGNALSGHLKGLASIIRNKASSSPLLPMEQNYYAPSSAKVVELFSSREVAGVLTLFSIRMLEWICFLDVSASSFGLGGDFNATVHSLLEKDLSSCQTCDSRGKTSLFQTFGAMQRYSNQLPCRFWGKSYPFEELLDDAASYGIYDLYGSCVQLRYLVSQLTGPVTPFSPAERQNRDSIEAAFHEVFEQHAQYFVLASNLARNTDKRSRVVKDVRFIIPYYYAALLYYLRCTALSETQNDRQQQAIKTIINLAFQAFQHEGDIAMLRIAWPLFMVLLETDDHLHRDWILTRLRALGKYGQNYTRATTFATEFLAAEFQQGKSLDLRKHLLSRSSGYFVI